MEKREVICQYCGDTIKSKDDLVVTGTAKFPEIEAYHTSCYAKVLKGMDAVGVGNRPINSVGTNIFAIASAGGLLVLLVLKILGKFASEYYLFMILFFLILAFRIYSWYEYERHLP